jgi:integrase
MFNALIKTGKATKNPATLVTFFEEPQKERILTVEEEQRIMEAIEKSDRRYAHLKDMITIALNTGMRQGEILAMKKSWINLREGLIIVPRHSQKRKKKDKRVPINSAIRPLIKGLLRKNPGSDYLFVNPESGTRYGCIQNSWNGILKKAGLKGKPGVDKLRFHDLRHTAANNLARAGKDMKFIAQYLGHSDVKISARYVHYSDEDLKEGAELLASPINFHNRKIKTPANPQRL